MVYRNDQAIYGSVAMAILEEPGKNSYRLVSDFRAENTTIEQAARSMPNLEKLPRRFPGLGRFADAFQPRYTTVFHSGDFHGFTHYDAGTASFLSATAYLRAVITDVLCSLIEPVYLVWVDGIVILGRTKDELLQRVMEVLSRFVERRICAAAHKAVLFQEDTKWCGKLYSGSGMKYDP